MTKNYGECRITESNKTKRGEERRGEGFMYSIAI